MNKFERVLITSIYKRNTRIEIFEENEYKLQVNKSDKKGCGGICEIVGLEEFQVKPYFDIDAKKELDKSFDETIIDDIETDIKKICNVEIYKSNRDPREYEEKMKYSFRLYLEARISYFNIPILFKTIFDKYDILDKSVYDRNRILFTPMNKIKKDDIVPELKIVNGEIFDNCATYIKEDYIDLDLEVNNKNKAEPKVDKVKDILNLEFNKDICKDDNDYDETPNKYNRLISLINLISPIRSDNFDTWIKFDWCLINICNKEHISKRKCYELIHQFSKLSTSNYNEDAVDTWIDDNYDRVKDKGYGWNYLIHTCIKEDNPKYYETISKSYFNMKKDFELNNAKIQYPPMIVHKDRNGENIIQPIPLCEKTNRHIKCSVKETNKKDETVYKDKKFIELWLDDPKIRIYEKYVFKPTPLKVEDYEYNTWTDFDITKTPLEKDDDDEIINRFLDYMKNLFNDENVVNYIIAYFANRIQNPAIRNMVCIILYGEEGDGKNRLFDIFKNIIGDKYYTELENAKQMFGSHSCVEKEKLFICVNEAKGKDNYENSETLKARITTDKLLINPKGIQEFKIDNFCDYIMTTNNANAVNLHDKSRRYLYVETTSYYSRNSEFFNNLSIDIVDNPKALRIIYEYLKAFDIRKIIPSGNFQNHIPETEIQKVIIKNNRDKILWFLEDYINDYINDPLNKEQKEELKIKNSELFSKWNNWIERNKMDIKYNNIAFHSRLGQLMKKKINCIDECIYKDTNQNTFIRIKPLSLFFDKLNQ
jgi:hypothetical protein